MINKAIILCGGTGSRMFPVTKSINKQILPLSGKPMFFYPLSLLMLCGVRNFLFIVNRNNKKYFTRVLGPTKDLGISVKYKIQNNPKLIANDSVAMILGDNFFYGSMLSPLIKESFLNPKGANIYLYPSKNTSAYGVVELGKNGSIKKIIEKPKFTRSDLVITGMYVFDKNVSLYAKKLKPSKRGETEIVDLINLYKKKKLLNIIKLGRGSAWLDVGSFEDLQNGSNFIQNIEQRQNYMIGCLEEISLNNKWINKKNLINRIKFFGNSNYARYLKDLLKY